MVLNGLARGRAPIGASILRLHRAAIPGWNMPILLRCVKGDFVRRTKNLGKSGEILLNFGF